MKALQGPDTYSLNNSETAITGGYNRMFMLRGAIIMITKKYRLTSILILLIVTPLFAAKFWESKEFTSWSEKECREMLTKSPWAYSNSFGQSRGPILDSQSTMPDDDTRAARRTTLPTGSFQTDSVTTFEFRLVTAKPIRMAMARLQLLQKPNDPSLLEQATKYVNAPPGKQIALQVSWQITPTGSSENHDINTYFLGATIAEFRTSTCLVSDKAGNVWIEEYLSPGPNRSNPTFIFPRLDASGNPLFRSDDKSIALRSQFTPTVGGKKKAYDIFIKMNPKQMKFQDELAM
jgi:hypothetical protein